MLSAHSTIVVIPRPRECQDAQGSALRTREMGDTSSDSTRMRGLYTFCFAKPGSMTYTMPSMVS